MHIVQDACIANSFNLYQLNHLKLQFITQFSKYFAIFVMYSYSRQPLLFISLSFSMSPFLALFLSFSFSLSRFLTLSIFFFLPLFLSLRLLRHLCCSKNVRESTNIRNAKSYTFVRNKFIEFGICPKHRFPLFTLRIFFIFYAFHSHLF